MYFSDKQNISYDSYNKTSLDIVLIILIIINIRIIIFIHDKVWPSRFSIRFLFAVNSKILH